jgi:glycosyltransferase involved in cell wall biosynthesis
MNDQMLISIVTVVFNERRNIAKTIESIIQYKSKGIEYVVIDGGSTDGTIDVVNSYRSFIDVFISEADNGIYDAMNKGILNSNGRYILNVNCGDTLLTNPLDHLDERQLYADRLDMILFNVLQSNNDIFYSKVSKALKTHNTIHHQGVLYKLNKGELYDTKYSVFSDFDLNQRLYKKNLNFLKLEVNLCKHDLAGASHIGKKFNENFHIIYKNFGPLQVLMAYFYHKMQGLKLRLKF